jgi:hypothetical protein
VSDASGAGGSGPAADSVRGPRSARASLIATAVTVLAGLAGGIAIWALTEWLSRSDVGGPGWSLRGNGALIVPFAFGPALLSGGWSALVLWHRQHPGWALGGLLAAVGAVALALIGGFLPIFVLARNPEAPPGFLIALANVLPLLVFLISLFGPLVVAGTRRSPARAAYGWLTLAALLLPVALLLGLFGSQRVVSAQASATIGPRTGHEAVLLQNGQVLAVGGTGAYGPLVSTVIYEPATGAWTFSGSLPGGAFGYAVAALDDGRALAVSGADPAGRSRAAIYDPSLRDWSEITAPALSGSAPRAVTLRGGTVLVVATGGGDAMPSASLYDPGTGAWMNVASPQSIRLVADITRLTDGRVLVVGMGSAAAAAAEIYDPDRQVWSPTSVPPIRALPVGSDLRLLSDGRVFLGGGGPETGGAAVYDPGSNGWAGLPPGASPIFDAGVAILADGRVLRAGGAVMEISNLRAELTGAAEVYDPALGVWSPTGSMRALRSGHSLTTLRDGRVLAAGGADRTGPLASAELYDPVTGRWTETGRMDGR